MTEAGPEERAEARPGPDGSRPARRRRLLRLAAIAALAAAAAAGLWLLGAGAAIRSALVSVLEWTRGMGPGGEAVLIAAYAIACVLFLPGSILTLGAGFAFGLVRGTVAVVAGSLLGASAAFLLGRTAARGWVERKIAASPRFRAIDAAVAREGFKIVLLARLSPVFPFNLLNYAFGVTRVSFRDYFLASWIGMFPGTVLYVYLGTAAKGLADLAAGTGGRGGAARYVLLGVGLAATLAVTIVLARIARRSLREAVEGPGAGGPAPTGRRFAVAEAVEVRPDYRYNQLLLESAHPAGWRNPDPRGRYHLVVVGAGTAGLVTAAGAAGLGARVALVERHLLGGDCLNYGCVPSKAIIRAARAWADVRDAGELGVSVPPGARVEFEAVMERMRRLRAALSANDSAARFRGLGVDVFLGQARFTGPGELDVEGRTLRFRRACIATGRSSHGPGHPRPGGDGLPHERDGLLPHRAPPAPRRHRRRADRLRDGPDLRPVRLEGDPPPVGRPDPPARRPPGRRHRAEVDRKDGVRVVTGAEVTSASRGASGRLVRFETAAGAGEVEADEVLVGAGRAPNVEGLGLEQAGVRYGPRGVEVDDRLRTTNPIIYAAGDICFPYQFTHTADALARIVIGNALFRGRQRTSALTIPWCTYTDPELAHVGLHPEEARAKGMRGAGVRPGVPRGGPGGPRR